MKMKYITNNGAFDDLKLSFTALGILSYVSIQPPDYIFTSEDICKLTPPHEDKESVKDGIWLLMKYGYIGETK